MTFEDFDKFQAELHKEIVGMLDTKGKEYAHSSSRFANFDRLAQELQISRLKVAWIYFKKHYDSIVSYIENGQTFSNESIRGRFVDAILYLELMAGMIEECQFISANTNIKITIEDKGNQGKHQPFEYDPANPPIIHGISARGVQD